MAFFLSTVLYSPIATHDTTSPPFGRPRNRSVSSSIRLNSSEVVFAVWASAILIALALVSAALGVAPLADPAIFPAS